MRFCFSGCVRSRDEASVVAPGFPWLTAQLPELTGSCRLMMEPNPSLQDEHSREGEKTGILYSGNPPRREFQNPFVTRPKRYNAPAISISLQHQ